MHYRRMVPSDGVTSANPTAPVAIASPQDSLLLFIQLLKLHHARVR